MRTILGDNSELSQITRNPQAITHTVLYLVGPLPMSLALFWSNFVYWTMYFNEGILISLSISRLYLLIKVSL